MSADIGSPLSSGRTAEIYDWDPQHVLKLFYEWIALESIQSESEIDSGKPFLRSGIGIVI